MVIKTIKHYTEKDVAMLGFHSSMILLDKEDVLGLIDEWKKKHCICSYTKKKKYICGNCLRAEELKARITG